jgi:hypothetical protein
MATRSAIGIMYGDVCKSIYVHWDGYLEGVGSTLLENYGRVGASELIACGNVSCLGAAIPDTKFFDDGAECLTTHSLSEFLDYYSDSWCEYFYIMGTDCQWYVTQGDENLVLLSEALAAERARAQEEAA